MSDEKNFARGLHDFNTRALLERCRRFLDAPTLFDSPHSPLIKEKHDLLNDLTRALDTAAGVELAEPWEEHATCGDCGRPMDLVRPGKFQCDDCPADRQGRAIWRHEPPMPPGVCPADTGGVCPHSWGADTDTLRLVVIREVTGTWWWAVWRSARGPMSDDGDAITGRCATPDEAKRAAERAAGVRR